MSAKELVDLDDKICIKTILENLKSRKKPVRLWQKLSSLHKVNYGHVDEVSFVENRVILRPFRGKKFSLSLNPYVYFHSNHRTTLFKTNIRSRDPLKLELYLPQFVKIKEGRAEKRRALGDTSLYFANIKLDGSGKDIKVQVLDISQKGVALSVPRSFFEHCQEGTIISLQSKTVPHLNGKIGLVRNQMHYVPNPTQPNFMRYRLGVEVFSEDNFEGIF